MWVGSSARQGLSDPTFNSVGELSSKCMSVNCLVGKLSGFLIHGRRTELGLNCVGSFNTYTGSIAGNLTTTIAPLNYFKEISLAIDMVRTKADGASGSSRKGKLDQTNG